MKQKDIYKLLFVFLCLLVSTGTSKAQDAYEEKQIKVFLRSLGHQVLLDSGDSTSRVLPIIKEDAHYKIPFESEFPINPDSLVTIVKRVLNKTEITNNFILEVKACDTGDIVYSFEIDHERASDIIACSSRLLPKACYSFLFSILDKKVSNETTPPATPIDTSSNTGYYVFGGLLALLAMVLIYVQWKKRQQAKRNSNLIPLGEYYFDKLNTELIIEQQRIELTSKEAELLLLLYDAANTTVEREVILNMVWGDKGDYVGRTLDVFISKLRKKLEFDSKVKIVNIRGIGYKLVLDV